MDAAELNGLTNFIWGIADDVLSDVYVRGKYRDVILPMTVLRRLDAVLEPTKQAVLDMKAALDRAGITNQDDALRAGSGQAFYNTSPFTLRDLSPAPASSSSRPTSRPTSTASRPTSRTSSTTSSSATRSPASPRPTPSAADREIPRQGHQPQSPARLGELPGPRQPRHGHDLRGTGPPLQRGEQRGGRRALDPARRREADGDLIFLPIADQIESGTYLLYDGACGTGGMLTARPALRPRRRVHPGRIGAMG